MRNIQRSMAMISIGQKNRLNCTCSQTLKLFSSKKVDNSALRTMSKFAQKAEAF